MAYVQACDELILEYSDVLANNDAHLDRRAELLAGQERLTQIACGERERLAERYARAVTFTDKVSSPEALADELKSQVQAGSLITYAWLVLNNSSHFWPEVQSTWEHYHLEAIKFAEQAMGNKSLLEQQKAFELAIFYAAFADHHLQDAFASGHSGFARINSSPNGSHDFHNYWNDKGRYFRGRTLDYEVSLKSSLTPDLIPSTGHNWENWYAFGDGNLCDGPRSSKPTDSICRYQREKNKRNLERMLILNKMSIKAFLLSFVGLRDLHASFYITQGFPVYAEDAELDLATFFHLDLLEDEDCSAAKRNNRIVSDSYKFDRKCWRPLDDPFLDPVFPLVVFEASTRSGFGSDVPVIPILSFEYGLYQYLPYWPPRLRIFGGFTPGRIDETVYSEGGLIVDMGGILRSPVSHKLAAGYAAWSDDSENFFSATADEERFFVDYRAQAEFSGGVSLGLGVGFQVPDVSPRFGVTLSYSVGAVGGGSREKTKKTFLGKMFEFIGM